jgi:hypothetical protein
MAQAASTLARRMPLDYLGGMSVVVPLTKKAAESFELEKLVAEYLDGGGSINRNGGQRVELRCSCCGYVGRLAVSLDEALHALRQQKRRHCLVTFRSPESTCRISAKQSC